MSMASCMRATTASSLSTFKRLKVCGWEDATVSDSHILTPSTLPSFRLSHPLPRLHHTRDRSDRFESPPCPRLSNSPPDTSPHHYYRHHLRRTWPADCATVSRNPSHSFIYRLTRLPWLAHRKCFPPFDMFYDTRVLERPGIPGFPNDPLSCPFPHVWGFRSPRVFTLDPFHGSGILVLRFILLSFHILYSFIDAWSPSNPAQRKRPYTCCIFSSFYT